jgi:hypothetical protein
MYLMINQFIIKLVRNYTNFFKRNFGIKYILNNSNKNLLNLLILGDFLNSLSRGSIINQININQPLDLIIDFVKIWKIQVRTSEIVLIDVILDKIEFINLRESEKNIKI